jgi:hypothetical protein
MVGNIVFCCVLVEIVQQGVLILTNTDAVTWDLGVSLQQSSVMKTVMVAKVARLFHTISS